jgi:hypothetical protein
VTIDEVRQDVNSTRHRRVRMMFGHDEAFTQLRDEGTVLTARGGERSAGPVWVSRSRTGEKKFDAWREHYATVQLDADDGFTRRGTFFEWAARIPLSVTGFDTVAAWEDALSENGDSMRLPRTIYVYLVERE